MKQALAYVLCLVVVLLPGCGYITEQAFGRQDRLHSMELDKLRSEQTQERAALEQRLRDENAPKAQRDAELLALVNKQSDIIAAVEKRHVEEREKLARDIDKAGDGLVDSTTAIVGGSGALGVLGYILTKLIPFIVHRDRDRKYVNGHAS